MVVAAKDVKVGDRVFNPVAVQEGLPEQFHWWTVGKVDINEERKRVVVCTAAFDSWYHPQEAVAIRRAEP
jgi:hypothetical protein